MKAKTSAGRYQRIAKQSLGLPSKPYLKKGRQQDKTQTWYYQIKNGIILRKDMNLQFKAFRTDPNSKYYKSLVSIAVGSKLTDEFILEQLIPLP